jgi:hypothetical protein
MIGADVGLARQVERALRAQLLASANSQRDA